MKRAILMGVVLTLVLGGVGQADVFVNPPETTWSPPWVTQFPYPRNIYWDFSTNPVGGPSPNGAPGAVYEGWLDPVLKSSDSVTFTGAVQYYSTVTTNGYTYTDAIGIVNTGTTTLTGTAVFLLDDTTSAGVKHIWVEDTGVAFGSGAQASIVPPAGYTASGEMNYTSEQISSSPLLYREDYGFVVNPNPPWEEWVVTFSVAPGGADLFTSLHIATECVPEPSTFTLAAVACLMGLGYAWRRRKAKATA
jgi:hypothetical protein